ncbi:hypothetical protein OA249_02200, partial [Litorivicinus sp.]|nr:hypothetical protein [Litorivicinus sp.]
EVQEVERIRSDETESLDGPPGSPTEIAVATLKEKLEDPSRKSEAESLYGSDGDELITAFSADALNENPEWGEDPDDEAEIASHQLELAQKYIEMNMVQTALEILDRVSVSPHKDSAEAARELIDVHRN